MKVIHLISGGDTGGARTHVYSLLKYLGQIIDVQLVCFRGGDFADGAAALGIPTMVLDRGFAANLGALKKLIRAGEYDLVHCHGSMANVMGALLRRSVRVPVISTVHSDYRLDYLGRRSPAPSTARSISGPCTSSITACACPTPSASG